MALVAGIVSGEFPIDAWYPIFLEVPDGGSKRHIGGRFPCLPGSSVNRVKWDISRVINLPVYKNTEGYGPETLRRVKAWSEFPDVPAVTLANRIGGYYCDERRAQTVSVLPVWADGTPMVLELDWYEGSLEDCCNPEWHLRASPRLPIKDGVDRLKQSCRHPPMWENCFFYLYVIPPFLGSYLLGRGNRTSSKVWQREWTYPEHAEMMDASDQVIADIVKWGIGGKE